MANTTSTDYELLVRDIYRGLLDQGDIRTVEIQHNVVLTGNSGASHQIDVYWQFEMAGVIHKTCVECRHYATKIKKSQVAAFSWTVDDLGAKGIMVTTAGYQKGAVTLANNDGIKLVRVNPVLRRIELEIDVFHNDVKDWVPVLNDEAVRELTEKYPTEDIRVTIVGMENELFFIDQDGNPKLSFKDLRDKIIHQGTPEGSHTEPLEDCDLPTNKEPVLIDAAECTVVRRKLETIRSTIGGDHIARAVIEDLSAGGVEQFFHADGVLTLNADRRATELLDPDSHPPG